MNSTDKRVDLFGRHAKRMPARTDAEREAAIALYAERQANGLDLWTGKPLTAEQLAEPEEVE